MWSDDGGDEDEKSGDEADTVDDEELFEHTTHNLDTSNPLSTFEGEGDRDDGGGGFVRVLL